MQRGSGLKIIFALALVILLAVVLFFMKSESTSSSGKQVIGGQTDEHGCLGAAGYGWDGEIGVCLRSWEMEDEATRRAAKLAVEYLGQGNGLTVVMVEPLACPECFKVKLERGASSNKEQLEVFIKDGAVSN